MNGKTNTLEYTKQINEVLNYIFKNLKGDLSLEKLADVANYSPFHFQRIFKQVVGESPKQYIIRTKLESSVGFLFIHKTKSITEIAMDCGFSSLSAFSRSFKDYFGMSAEELRGIDIKDRIKLLKSEGYVKELLKHEASTSEFRSDKNSIQIIVKKINSIHGIFTNTSLKSDKIISSFRKSIQVAETNDIDISNSNFIGIIYPHQDLYRALITYHPNLELSKKINNTEIKSGRYASFKINGDMETMFEGFKYFNENWLPHSGYRMADLCGFEILSQNPIGKAYHEIEREIYIPIEPI